MKNKPFFLLFTLTILLLAACNRQQPAEGIATAVRPSQVDSTKASAGSGTLFSIDEVGLGQNGYVALTNFTDQPASLRGLFLCQGARCYELPDIEVAPGATARVGVGNGEGLKDVVATQAAIGELRPSDGEIALYASKKLNDPKAMLAYLEWGSTPHNNTQTAIDAGLWIKGSFAPSSTNAKRLYRNEGGLWLFDEQ